MSLTHNEFLAVNKITTQKLKLSFIAYTNTMIKPQNRHYFYDSGLFRILLIFQDLNDSDNLSRISGHT